jgi:DNA-binding PadR family transcriptional regulator
VRREFQLSLTPYWSGSAGAIYPAVARLARRRLIRAAGGTGNGRGGVLYVVTAAGNGALRRWLGPPFSPMTVGAPPDPVRTRVGFLGLLSAAERRAFLTAAAEAVAARLPGLAAAADAPQLDPHERLALRGSRQTMEARVAWLREGMAAVDDPAGAG